MICWSTWTWFLCFSCSFSEFRRDYGISPADCGFSQVSNSKKIKIGKQHEKTIIKKIIEFGRGKNHWDLRFTCKNTMFSLFFSKTTSLRKSRKSLRNQGKSLSFEFAPKNCKPNTEIGHEKAIRPQISSGSPLPRRQTNENQQIRSSSLDFPLHVGPSTLESRPCWATLMDSLVSIGFLDALRCPGGPWKQEWIHISPPVSP